MQASMCTGLFVCACTYTNEHPSHRRVMHMDTTVKLLPGTQRFWEKKIHLGRIDEPRSAKAYDFGNSLAVFQNFFGQSTSLIACKTHGNLSIYSLELWTLETLRPARLIRLGRRVIMVGIRSPIRRRTFWEFVSFFGEAIKRVRIFEFEDTSNVYLILKRLNLNLVLCKCIDIDSLMCKYLFKLLPKIKKKYVVCSMYNVCGIYAKCNNVLLDLYSLLIAFGPCAGELYSIFCSRYSFIFH